MGSDNGPPQQKADEDLSPSPMIVRAWKGGDRQVTVNVEAYVIHMLLRLLALGMAGGAHRTAYSEQPPILHTHLVLLRWAP